MRPRPRSVGALVAMLLGGLSSQVAAETIAIGALEAPPELSVPATSLRLLLETTSGGVTAGPADLPSKRSEVPAALKSAGAEIGLSGKLSADGPFIAVELRVVSASGKHWQVRARAPRNHLGQLAQDLATQVSDKSGVRFKVAAGEVTLGEMYPYAMASRYAGAGDKEHAARVIISGRRRISHSVGGAKRITTSLLDDQLVRVRSKLSIASTFDLFDRGSPLIATLPEKDMKPWTTVFDARRELARMRAKEALSTINKVRSAKLPEALLTRAQAAHRAGDKRALRKALAEITRAKALHPPTIAWLASLPKGTIPKGIAKKLVARAPELREDHPVLSNRLALMAADQGDRASLMQLDTSLLSEAESKKAQALLLAKGTELDAAEQSKLVDLSVGAGEAELAVEQLNAALAKHPEDKELLARKQALISSLDTADEGADVEPESTGTKEVAVASKPSDDVRRVAAELTSLLATFDVLGELRAVVVAPSSIGGNAIWAPRVIDVSLFDRGLHAALQAAPLSLTSQSSKSTVAQPISREGLSEMAALNQAGGVVLYELEPKGRQLHVKLMVYRKGDESASVFEKDINGVALGLLTWNPWLLRIGSVLAVALLALFIIKVVRGYGEVAVRVKLESGKSGKEYLSMKIDSSSTSPKISDVDAYVHRLKTQGTSQRGLMASNIGKSLTFRKVPTGKRFVHLYGVVVAGNEVRPIDETRDVRVKRRDTCHVTFDLVPKKVEYRLRVTGEGGPLRGASVWLEENGPDEAKETDRDGRVTVWAPLGHQSIRLRHDGEEIAVDVHAASTQRQDKGINFDRELRLATLARGIEIEQVEASDVELEKPPEVAATMASPAAKLAAQPTPAKTVSVSFGNKKPEAQAASESSRDSSLTGLKRYRPEKELGSGAMGVVLLATDQVLERTVALKVMSKEVQQHPAAAKMFMQEAKALAALNHPNIVTVFDQGSDDGQMYIVMEFVEGQTLEDRLEEGKLSVLEALAVTAQIAEGLAYAHQRRVIHRDIKPANIFLDRRNRVKIGDFGLARVTKEAMIKHTEIKGTPLYMSPEQITGKNIDGRSDIYSVGCTLYEMLTGQPPFVEGEILYHHMHTDPAAPSSIEPAIPAAVDDFVMRCISKEKDKRPATPDDMVRELRDLL